MGAEEIIDQIFAQFRRHGHRLYHGEVVSMAEHMLQTAYVAERHGANAMLVAAAILHDYGHLMHDLPEGSVEQGIDNQHEERGATFLSRYFVPDVTEPIRMHVAAKRYLCAVAPEYYKSLSPASAQSLRAQGGPFNEAEIKAFESSPYFADAVQLRRYDEIARAPDLTIPTLEHYRAVLRQALRQPEPVADE